MGASGSFTTKQKGLWVMPMQTVSHGIQVCKEADSTLHEECPYVLWSPCRASIERGVSLIIPSWGGDACFELPGGIKIMCANRYVLGTSSCSGR